MVEACMLIRTEKGKFIDVVEKIKNIKVVKDAYPVLGRYDAVVHMSAPNVKELGMTVMKVSNMAGIVFSETLIEVEQ
jgi:DNA-binding Lrp family transcriptional regulator